MNVPMYKMMINSVGGSEFDGEFKTYLRDKGVKQIFRDSHSPQPHVEAYNNFFNRSSIPVILLKHM